MNISRRVDNLFTRSRMNSAEARIGTASNGDRRTEEATGEKKDGGVDAKGVSGGEVGAKKKASLPTQTERLSKLFTDPAIPRTLKTALILIADHARAIASDGTRRSFFSGKAFRAYLDGTLKDPDLEKLEPAERERMWSKNVYADLAGLGQRFDLIAENKIFHGGGERSSDFSFNLDDLMRASVPNWVPPESSKIPSRGEALRRVWKNILRGYAYGAQNVPTFYPKRIDPSLKFPVDLQGADEQTFNHVMFRINERINADPVTAKGFEGLFSGLSMIEATPLFQSSFRTQGPLQNSIRDWVSEAKEVPSESMAYSAPPPQAERGTQALEVELPPEIATVSPVGKELFWNFWHQKYQEDPTATSQPEYEAVMGFADWYELGKDWHQRQRELSDRPLGMSRSSVALSSPKEINRWIAPYVEDLTPPYDAPVLGLNKAELIQLFDNSGRVVSLTGEQHKNLVRGLRHTAGVPSSPPFLRDYLENALVMGSVMAVKMPNSPVVMMSVLDLCRALFRGSFDSKVDPARRSAEMLKKHYGSQARLHTWNRIKGAINLGEREPD